VTLLHSSSSSSSEDEAPSAPSGGRSTNKKRSPALATTARRAKKQKAKIQVKRGGRVKVLKKNLYPICTDDSQRNGMKGQPNNKNYWGSDL
jgi:hypothetical protein